MCLVREAINHSISRRRFLKGAGVLAATPLLAGFGARALAASSPGVITQSSASKYRTQLVLLGTAGGPFWWPDSNRVGTSSALVVGDAIYLIDLGHGATHRLAQAFNSGVYADTAGGKVEKGEPTFLRNVEALFFTHLHMDHTADYPTLLLIGPENGLGLNKPLKVLGPGNRGMLAKDVYNLKVPVVNPENPTPGTVEMTNYLLKAFAQTINDFTRDDGASDFTKRFEVSDIQLPFKVDDPNKTPCPPMDPFKIYEDHRTGITVKATLVDHHQVFPAFAFRFDTNDGSVVFSGDTGPHNANLIKMAKGADILVHEVIDQAWIDLLFGPEPSDPTQQALLTHLKTSHTMITDVGAVAEAAGVKTLVLNHIGPGNTPIAHLMQAQQNFSGHLIIGEDLMKIGLGKAVPPGVGQHK
jgi:ribonuclease BN (tRNA processing enzyme)